MFNPARVFNRVLVFLRLRKKEEDEGYVLASETRMFWNFQIFNIDDHNQSRLVNLYYVFYRFFHYSPWVNPRNAYYEVKYFIQRGSRGWSDRDIWSLDNYLSSWLPDALRKLKKDKHGTPCFVFEPEDMGEEGYSTEEGHKRATARWNAIMDKMIQGFEADRRAQSGLYEEELGEYPMDRPSGISADVWEKIKDDRFHASKALTERDLKIAEEGMLLFVKHFGSLWD